MVVVCIEDLVVVVIVLFLQKKEKTKQIRVDEF